MNTVNTTSVNSTPKMNKFQKIRWMGRWIGLFIALLVLTVVLTPALIGSDQQAAHLKQFLVGNSWVFLIIHLLFALSALAWFPWYIRRRAVSHQWREGDIDKALQYKWWVVGILAIFAIMLWII